MADASQRFWTLAFIEASSGSPSGAPRWNCRSASRRCPSSRRRHSSRPGCGRVRVVVSASQALSFIGARYPSGPQMWPWPVAALQNTLPFIEAPRASGSGAEILSRTVPFIEARQSTTSSREPAVGRSTQPRCHSSRRAALWDRDDPPLGRSAPGRCPTSRLGNSPRLGLENFGVAVPNGIALHEGPPGAAIRADHPDVAALSSTALHRGAADSSKPATRCRSEQPAALPFIEAAWCRWPGAGP